MLPADHNRLFHFFCHTNFVTDISIIHNDIATIPSFRNEKKSFADGSPQVSIKQCQILKRTMRTLLRDLAQKSLKGLGTKARTNWEDRSANSLAYQVSNHCTFLYAGCISLPSSHRMRAIFPDFKGYSSALELGAWRAQHWYFVSEHAWQDDLHLKNTSHLVSNANL